MLSRTLLQSEYSKVNKLVNIDTDDAMSKLVEIQDLIDRASNVEIGSICKGIVVHCRNQEQSRI